MLFKNISQLIDTVLSFNYIIYFISKFTKICSRFFKLLGFVDQQGMQLLDKRIFSNLHSNMEQSKLIEKTAEFLTNFFRDKEADTLANGIYHMFLAADDEAIFKVIRKIFVIYQQKVRTIKLNWFLKWKLSAKKMSLRINNMSKQLTHPQTIAYKKKISEDTQKAHAEHLKTTTGNSCTLFRNESSKNQISKTDVFSINKQKEEIYDRLYRDRFRREMIKNELGKFFRFDEVKECTFRPRISTFNRPLRSKNCNCNNNSCFVVLATENKTSQENFKKLSYEKLNTHNNVYSFEPQLNSKKIIEDVQRLKDRNETKPRRENITKNLKNSGQIKKQSKLDDKAINKDQGVTFQATLNHDIHSKNKTNDLGSNNNEFLKSKTKKNAHSIAKSNSEATFKMNRNENNSVLQSSSHSARKNKTDLSSGDPLFQNQVKWNKPREEIKENTHGIVDNIRSMREFKEDQINPHSTQIGKKPKGAIQLQNISDSKILDQANQYITTDESLEKFLRENYKKMKGEYLNSDNSTGKLKQTVHPI